MAKPTVKPEWATGGGAVVTEPSLGKKQTGWLSPEKPSDGVWNWLHNKTYQWLNWLDTQTDGDYLIGRRLTAGTGITLTPTGTAGSKTETISVTLPSVFNKITTATTTSVATFASAKIVKSIIDCSSVSAGVTRLIVDGVTRETIASGSKAYRVFESSSAVSITTNNVKVNISSASFVGFGSVSSQSTTPHGVHLKSDGTKMYVLDGVSGTGSKVYQYTLGTAYTASTLTYDSVVYDVGATVSAARDLYFSTDGTKMFVLNATNVYQFALATAWSLASGVTYIGTFSLSASGSIDSEGLSFGPNGLKMYVLDTVDRLVRQYDLSTAWTISTAVYASKSFSFNAQVTSADALMVSSDETKFYVVANTNDTIYQYSMTNGEITTGSYDSVSFSVAAQDTIPIGAYMRPDLLGFYICGSNIDRIYQYSSGTAYSGTVYAHTEYQ